MTLPQLLQEIQRLAALAFPGLRNETTDALTKDAFLDALADQSLALKVRERELQNVHEAARIASQFEAFAKNAQQHNRSGNI